jgi:S-formylglutathione hydrolase
MVFPDTSPRGVETPHVEEGSYIGPSAGFYVDATTEGWKNHY